MLPLKEPVGHAHSQTHTHTHAPVAKVYNIVAKMQFAVMQVITKGMQDIQENDSKPSKYHVLINN